MERLRNISNKEICEENGLKYEIMSNIVDEQAAITYIRSTMQIIAKTLASTLGPEGSTTILQDREGAHLITKDGLDVVSRLTFSNQIAQTVLDVVRSISREQVGTVGDGSTSTIIVANALYQELTSEENNELFKKISPKTILDILNDISDYLEEELKLKAAPLSEDFKELEKIAGIAMNNDIDGGKMIAEIYQNVGKNGFIHLDKFERYEKDFIDYKKGITWKRGYIDTFYGEMEPYEAGKVIHKEPMVFITDGSITYEDCENYFKDIIPHVCNVLNKELVIIANYITDEARNFFKTARNYHKINPRQSEKVFTIVDIEQSTDTGKNLLKDIALVCGCDIFKKDEMAISEILIRLQDGYTKDDKYKFFGKVLSATINKSSTDFICDEDMLSKERLEEKNKKVRELEEEIAELELKVVLTNDERHRLFESRLRISDLLNKSAILHIGGKSKQERDTRQRLIEDAILASKSAIDHGYIIGGNLAIPVILDNPNKLINRLIEKFKYLSLSKRFYQTFISIIKKSFLESYTNVLNNSYLSDDEISGIIKHCVSKKSIYNLKTKKMETLSNTNIINSTDTDIQIMKSTISLIGLLATSNQFITVTPQALDDMFSGVKTLRSQVNNKERD